MNDQIRHDQIRQDHSFKPIRIARPPRPSNDISNDIPTSLAAAAQEETFLLGRDAQIAAALGLSPPHVTHVRQSCLIRWELWERRWLQDGPKLLAAAEKRKAAREAARLQRQEEEEAIWGQAATVEAQAGIYPHERGDEPLWVTHFHDSLGVLFVLIVAGVLAGTFAAHHHLIHLPHLFLKGLLL